MRFSEVILTLGSSQTVIEFLCAAKEKKRSFRVFVAEGAPRFVQVATPFLQGIHLFPPLLLCDSSYLFYLVFHLGIRGIFLPKNWLREDYKPQSLLILQYLL